MHIYIFYIYINTYIYIYTSSQGHLIKFNIARHPRRPTCTYTNMYKHMYIQTCTYVYIAILPDDLPAINLAIHIYVYLQKSSYIYIHVYINICIYN